MISNVRNLGDSIFEQSVNGLEVAEAIKLHECYKAETSSGLFQFFLSHEHGGEGLIGIHDYSIGRSYLTEFDLNEFVSLCRLNEDLILDVVPTFNVIF